MDFLKQLGLLYAFFLPKGQTQRKQRVVSANTTAALDEVLHVVTTATITNPATPVEGRGFWVWVRSGATATLSTGAVAGPAYVFQRYHSGAWGQVSPTNTAVSSATDTTAGIAELATSAETIAGTDTGRVVTPAGNKAALDGKVDPIAATRAPLEGVFYGDAATSNRRIEWTMGTAGNVAGSPITETFSFRVPTSNPSASAIIFQYVGSSTGGVVTGSDATTLHIAADGALTLRRGTDGSNRSSWTIPGWRAAYSGQFVRLDFVSAGNTATFPTVYQNGTALSGWGITVSAGTTPNWQSTGMAAAYRQQGSDWPATEFVPGAVLNRALTAAEVLTMVQTNSLLPQDRFGGSMVALTAGSFIARRPYRILTVGTTDYTLIGASANTVGVEFIATGVGSGTGTALPIGAIIQPDITRTSQLLDNGPNRIRGQATAGIRAVCDGVPEPFEFVLTTTGAFVTGASTNPLFFETGMLTDVYAMASIAGADLTLRNNSSSTNDIVTALTDLPTTNPTRLTLIDAQRNVAALSTLWGAASTGTITIRGFWTRR